MKSQNIMFLVGVVCLVVVLGISLAQQRDSNIQNDVNVNLVRQLFTYMAVIMLIASFSMGITGQRMIDLGAASILMLFLLSKAFNIGINLPFSGNRSLIDCGNSKC